MNDNDYRDGWTPEVRAHLLDNIESLRREMTSIMSTLPPHVVAAPGWHCAPAPGAPWPCPATPPACASGPTRSRGRPWSTTPTGARLHIAFMHHPPTWLADWKHVEPYLSRAHLLLFGHEHKYKAEQPIDGRTVFVYAGAVGPHEGEGDDYVPSWNLITLKRADDRVHITIEPRVWSAKGTCFGTHPDGTTAKTVWVDLQGQFVEQARNQEVEVVEADDEAVNAPVTSANPLMSDLGDAPGGADLPVASDRSRLRELTVAFLKLTRTQRNQLAAQLGLDSGLADVDPHDVSNEILRRVREANKINELAEKLNHA